MEDYDNRVRAALLEWQRQGFEFGWINGDRIIGHQLFRDFSVTGELLTTPLNASAFGSIAAKGVANLSALTGQEAPDEKEVSADIKQMLADRPITMLNVRDGDRYETFSTDIPLQVTEGKAYTVRGYRIIPVTGPFDDFAAIIKGGRKNMIVDLLEGIFHYQIKYSLVSLSDDETTVSTSSLGLVTRRAAAIQKYGYDPKQSFDAVYENPSLLLQGPEITAEEAKRFPDLALY
jgi:hypothetical protein